ncbi:MAG TPA: universal stress protein [Methylomirabilota bacterium]|nr:universal stress protein [Methylomirabilota bacterium]
MKPERILVPLDGSSLAESALPVAVDLLAGTPNSTLLLLRAAEALAFLGGDPIEAQVQVVREAEEYLDAVRARLAGSGVAEVKTSVCYGPAASFIIETAQVAKADMIVMTTHGRSGLRRLVFGSVAEAVLRGTRTPILLIRDAAAPLHMPASDAAMREVSHV